jgi:NAD(P)-dependent dehydrogenase (short-subunit alcohol dehydrogenase family)
MLVGPVSNAGHYIYTAPIEGSDKATLITDTDRGGHAACCPTKDGVNRLKRVLALEWGARGFTVNAVGPTYTCTPGTAGRLDNPEYRQGVIDRIAPGQIATIADLVFAVTLVMPVPSSVRLRCLELVGPKVDLVRLAGRLTGPGCAPAVPASPPRSGRRPPVS